MVGSGCFVILDFHMTNSFLKNSKGEYVDVLWFIYNCLFTQVYFGMLDALLANEVLPDEYRSHQQV